MDAITQARLTDFLTANLGNKTFTIDFDEIRLVCTVSMPELTKPDYIMFSRWCDRSFPEIRMEFVRPASAREGNDLFVDEGDFDLKAKIAEEEALSLKISSRLLDLKTKQAEIDAQKGK